MSYSDLRYNEVRQTSSHNSFQRSEGIYDQVVYWRIRSLEIDLHLGKPFRDALKKDWYVYHVAGIDPDTTVDLDEFTDIIGRHFRQPKEGLGFDDSPASHMWRTINWPTRYL